MAHPDIKLNPTNVNSISKALQSIVDAFF